LKSWRFSKPLMPAFAVRNMERLDKTHKVEIFLGALLVATLILKWKLVYFIRPHDYTTTSLIGSSLVGIFIIGSVAGAIGLFTKRIWGCFASYFAAIGATSIGISVIPLLSKLIPGGYARTYMVIVLNLIFIIAIVIIHINLHRIKVQLVRSANK